MIKEQLGEVSVNIPQEQSSSASVNKQVRVTALQGLNARSGEYINYAKVGAYVYNTILKYNRNMW